MSKPIIRTDIVLGVIVLILVAGVFMLGHRLWWFTPASTQRQTMQHFFSDLTAGNTTAAYKLTDSVFQKTNSYSTVDQPFSVLKNDKVAVNYSTYLAKDDKVSIVGQAVDKTASKTYYFGATFVSPTGNKIDALTFYPLPN